MTALAPLLVSLLVANADAAADKCETRCTERQNTCASVCAGSNHCMTRCGDDAAGCLRACRPPAPSEKQNHGAASGKRPDICGVNADYTPRYCTPRESQARNEMMKEQMKKVPKGYACKDADGNVVLCPEKKKEMFEDPRVLKIQAQARACVQSGGDKEKCPPELQAQMKEFPGLFGKSGQ